MDNGFMNAMDQEHHKGGACPIAAGADFVVFLIHWIHESIIHHVSLSIILSRLRIHLEPQGLMANGAHGPQTRKQKYRIGQRRDTLFPPP